MLQRYRYTAWYHFIFLTPAIILIFFFCAVRYSFPYKKMVPVHPSFVKFILFTIFLFILFIMFIIFIIFIMFRDKMAPVQPSFIMFSVKPQGSEAVSVRVVACSVGFCIAVGFLSRLCLFPCCRISRIWMDLGTKATPMWRWDLEIHKRNLFLDPLASTSDAMVTCQGTFQY